MKRIALSMFALIGVAAAVGVGCKHDNNNGNDDMAGLDMAGGGNDLSVVSDMAMRTPANGQVIIAEIDGKVYSASGPDGGIVGTGGMHAIAAIASFPEFEPLLGANDESNLKFLPTPGGCSVYTYDPLAGDLPEASANAGAISAGVLNGGIGGFAPPAAITDPLPSGGVGIGCARDATAGQYGCVFQAFDKDMATSQWAGILTSSAVFPPLLGTCPPNYFDAGGVCLPMLMPNTLSISVAGSSGPFATGTNASKANVTVPGKLTVTGIKLGSTSLTLPSAGSSALEALDGNLTSDAALEVSFTCGGSGAGSCTSTGGTEAGIVGLLATTSAAPRGLTPAATAKVAVAQCVAAADAGKISMTASQVTKLRAAAAGGSIRFILARINAQVDGENTPRLIVRGAGRGEFAYINQ